LTNYYTKLFANKKLIKLWLCIIFVGFINILTNNCAVDGEDAAISIPCDAVVA
jgi:hypothetical protein